MIGVSLALNHENATTGHHHCFALPPEVTYQHIANMMLARVAMLNWLDPLRFQPGFLKSNDVFSRPNQRDLRAGVVANVDALNIGQTGFPQLMPHHINELCGGSYQHGLVRRYFTAIRYQQTAGQPFVTLAHYNQVKSGIPLNLPSFMWDQQQPPRGWNPVLYGQWEPCRILVIRDIPSQYIGAGSHHTAVAFVPTTWPPPVNPGPGYTSPLLGHILAFCCGPRTQAGCRTGARTAVPCAHCTFSMWALGVVSHNRALFVSTWKDLNYMDASQTMQYNEMLHTEMHH
jgi:hypothetical protein